MKNIPFLDLKQVNEKIGGEIRQAIARVLDSGWYILGNEGRNFERRFAASLSGDRPGYAVGCNSGTDALILSLRAAGVGQGDEVVTVSHTAIPTVTAIVTVGATPVFADIDPDTWMMDVKKAAALTTEKTKAIVCVHLYGNMVDVFHLKSLLRDMGREDIAVIEDTAQAHGSSLRGVQAGAIGDFGAFSFYPSKNIGALGDGGAVFTASKQSYDALAMYRNYGQKDRYHAEIPNGINSRLDELQAAILDVKLNYLAEWNKQKSVLMDIYRARLSGQGVSFQQVTDGCDPAWHLCVIRFAEEIDRELMQKLLLERGIQTLIHYPTPAHLQTAFLTRQKKELPNTERLTKQILSLPFNCAMEKSEVEEVCDRVISCLQQC